MLAKLLFAQDFNIDFGQQPQGLPPEVTAVMFVIFAIVFVVALAISIGLLYLVFSCYQRIPPQHRQMEPWQVWLLLIPVFPIVWNFFVYPKLAKSYQSYFAEQGRTDVGDCGEKIGLWFAICAAAIVTIIIPCLGMITGPIAALAALVLWIIFIVKALGLKGQIPQQTI